ncbi:MAG: guanylyltransferase [Clostridia bacterium]|nr:guanylyltransferase [Clostridia bacterium]
MIFEELDQKMRIYEQSVDQCILPELYMVARIDGRSFTRLTKEICRFEAPFDVRFRDMMVETVKALMDCGFRVVYGYTQSDEISLLFSPDENTFARKIRKYKSIRAGTASAAFSLQLGQTGVFDCRMIPLPTVETVRDYFLWRQEDAARNALNSHCYWLLRKEGKTVAEATKMLEGQSVAFKNELLFQRGINFDKLSNWQKRGTGVCRRQVEKEGFNPVTGETVTALRNSLAADYELPIRKAYGDFIERLITEQD